MRVHFHNELETLKKQMLYLAVSVEQVVQDSITALIERDRDKSKAVFDADNTIDEKEVEIEEGILKLLALHTPVATDLRFLIGTLKINNDLERVGDLGVSIARRAKRLSKLKNIDPPFDFEKMAAKTLELLKVSIEAFIEMDVEKAKIVFREDDIVDDMNREAHHNVRARLVESTNDVETVECLTNYMSVSKSLERIADYATNICEDVVYMVEGNIVRHDQDFFKED